MKNSLNFNDCVLNIQDSYFLWIEESKFFGSQKKIFIWTIWRLTLTDNISLAISQPTESLRNTQGKSYYKGTK